MANRIRKNDLVKVISGDHKGKVARVTQILSGKNQALLEGIGQRVRHVSRSEFNPTGGKRDIQTGIDLSKLALVIDEKSGKTSRVGYQIKDGQKVRVARQANNRVIDNQTIVTKTKTKKGAKK